MKLIRVVGFHTSLWNANGLSIVHNMDVERKTMYA